MKETTINTRLEKAFSVVLWLIIALGIALRIIVYLQNRDLIIDEANIARNLSERDFWGLAKPLDYAQYAPPIFLWIEKLFVGIFGLGELSLKIYPMLTGIAGLFVMRSVLLKLIPASAAWLPLLMMATTYWYILYSTTVKQYMPDAMISLILIWFALRYDLIDTPSKKFTGIWMAIGIVAVWSSMPSVFVLTGVGAYYCWQCWQQRDKQRFMQVVLISIVWLLNFAVYYMLILKAQVGSKYLQDYHANYFLIATPANFHEWQHNWARIKEIINNLGGYAYRGYQITLLLLLMGGVSLLIKRKDLLFLLATPVAITLLAAALRQFSLIDRVILFMMPILLLILGYGFAQIMRIRFALVKLAGIYMGIYITTHYGEYKFFKEELPSPEIGKALDFIIRSGGKGNQLFIHDATVPVYIYYTEIAPRKPEWTALKGGRPLDWDDHYNSVLRGYSKGNAFFVFSGGYTDLDKEKRAKELALCVFPVDSFHAYISQVMVYNGNVCK